jgi:hypothetical protein
MILQAILFFIFYQEHFHEEKRTAWKIFKENWSYGSDGGGLPPSFPKKDFKTVLKPTQVDKLNKLRRAKEI